VGPCRAFYGGPEYWAVFLRDCRCSDVLFETRDDGCGVYTRYREYLHHHHLRILFSFSVWNRVFCASFTGSVGMMWGDPCSVASLLSEEGELSRVTPIDALPVLSFPLILGRASRLSFVPLG